MVVRQLRAPKSAREFRRIPHHSPACLPTLSLAASTRRPVGQPLFSPNLRILIMSFALMVFAAIVVSGQESSPIPVRPSDTDPAITKFNDPHLVYHNSAVKKRNELLVFLPGTNGRPGGTGLFCQTGADLGYHVLALAYSTDVAAATVRDEPDRQAFEKFRTEIIEGRDLWGSISVSRVDSIEHRLTKAIAYLAKTRPNEGWGQFLEGESKLKWGKMAVSGHSQGGGHAGLIGVKHRVARVVMTGAPKDYDRATDSPAAWYRKGATPAGAFFAFNHVLDRQGCDYEQQLQNLRALGLFAFGEPVMVDKQAAPFKHSRMLFTNFEGSPTESVRAHSTVIGDGITPKDAKGEPVFRAVWKYMLTEPTTRG